MSRVFFVRRWGCGEPAGERSTSMAIRRPTNPNADDHLPRRWLRGFCLAIYAAMVLALPFAESAVGVTRVGCRCGDKGIAADGCCCVAGRPIVKPRTGTPGDAVRSCCQKPPVRAACCGAGVQATASTNASKGPVIDRRCNCGDSHPEALAFDCSPHLTVNRPAGLGPPRVEWRCEFSMSLRGDLPAPSTPPPRV